MNKQSFFPPCAPAVSRLAVISKLAVSLGDSRHLAPGPDSPLPV